MKASATCCAIKGVYFDSDVGYSADLRIEFSLAVAALKSSCVIVFARRDDHCSTRGFAFILLAPENLADGIDAIHPVGVTQFSQKSAHQVQVRTYNRGRAPPRYTRGRNCT